MDEKVLIMAFSKGNLVSRRELSLHRYYDESHPEIDDSDHIRIHGIDMVEQHFLSDGNEIITINYYNEKGSPYRFEKLVNGVLEVVEL